MAFDLTAADPLMKIHFAPRVEKQFNTAAIFYNRVAAGRGIPISNRGYEIPVHTSGNPTGTFFDDGGPLPAGDGESVLRSLALYKRYALAVQFTGDALDATEDDAIAYARALAFNIRNATIIAIKDLNMYSWGDGTGIIGKGGAAAATLDGASQTMDLSGTADGARYVRKNMILDVQSGTTATVRGTVKVVSITSATAVVVAKVSGTDLANFTSGDAIVRTGTLNKAFTGVRTLIDDTAAVVQGLDRNTVIEWKANHIALAGSPPLARDHMRRSLALIQIALGDANPGDLTIWSYPSQVQAYADMGWPMKRFTGGGAGKLDLGYTSYEWEGVPWVVDTDMPKDTLMFLNLSTLFKVTARPLGFDDRTGNILRQVPSSTAGRYDDKFVAFLVARFNLGCYTPRASTKLDGLGIPSGY